MNKKGLNDIITTVLIILLSISAIVIVWGFVKSSLDNAEDKISTGSVVLSPLKLESVKVNPIDDTKLDVIIERTNNNPELEVSGAILIFIDVNGNTGSMEIDEQTIVKNLFERKSSTLTHSLPQGFDFSNFQVVIRAKTKDKSGEDIILSSSSKKVYSDGVQVIGGGGGDECVDGVERPCGPVGDLICNSIKQTCVNGQWEACPYSNLGFYYHDDEGKDCDGQNNDCDLKGDGSANVDEGCCSNECVLENKNECVGATTNRVCGNYDSDSCLEWSVNNDCSVDDMICDQVVNSLTEGECIVPQQPTPLPTGLVGYWSFDGDNANDESGLSTPNNGNVGTGVSFATGRIGKSALFDTTNAGITIPDSTSLDLRDSLSVCSWIKMAPTTDLAVIFAKGSVSTTSDNIQYGLYRNSGSTQIIFKVSSGEIITGSTISSSIPSTQLVEGTWYYVCGVWNSGTQRTNIYLNGVSKDNDGASFTQLSSVTGIGLGAETWPTPDRRFWKGELDEVMVFNRALTQQEIADLYLR